MAVAKAEIVYGAPHATYYSGETLFGSVVLETKQPLEIKKIFVRLRGRAKVRWNEPISETEGESNANKWLTSKEEYLDVDIHLKEFKDANDVRLLEEGHHRFPFTYLLPSDLPATFQSTSGVVVYTCEAIIEPAQWISLFTNKIKAKQAFTLIPNIDFDSLPNSKTMVTHKTSRGLHTCCWTLGSLKVSANINRGAFIPGDTVVINVEISNQSSAYLNHIESKLKKTVTCKAGKDLTASRLDERSTICGIQSSTFITPYQEFIWDNIEMIVPPTPPSGLGGNCKIIQVDYYIKATDWCSSGVTFKIPVVIGSPPPGGNGYGGSTGFREDMPIAELTSPPLVITSQPVNNSIENP